MLRPRIKTSHHVIETPEGDLCIGDVRNNSYLLRKPSPALRSLVERLDGSRTPTRIVKDVLARHPGTDPTEVSAALERFKSMGLVEDAAASPTQLSKHELDLYDRQMLYFSAVDKAGLPGFTYQERLKSQVAVIFGMGGWGTWIALNLALCGVGRMVIVDGDVVDVSNLNRQVLYGQDDANQLKVEVARRRIQAINPNVEVTGIAEFVRRDEAHIEGLMPSDATMLFLAWANMAYYREGTCEELVHRVCERRGLPVAEMGGDPLDISVGPIYLNDGSAPGFTDVRRHMRERFYGTESEPDRFAALKEARVQGHFRNGHRVVNAWQNAPSISAMAGLVVGEAVKVMTGCEESALVGRQFRLSLGNFHGELV